MKDNISRSSIFRDSMRRKAEERNKNFNNSKTPKKESNENCKKSTQQEIEDFENDR